MKHYYFKFLPQNKGLKIWNEKNPEQNKNEIHLPIYFGKWKKNEYTNDISRKFSSNKKGIKINQDQIDTFFNLENLGVPTYFWIFDEDEILCFEGLDLKVFDGPVEYIDENKSLPKCIKACKIKSYKKIEHPEFFSNINSNQKYNRRTIVELENKEKEYANALINKTRIVIDQNNFLEYLSPTEFETLIFLIFTNEDSVCSSFRGGTLKNYDLRVFLEKDFHGISKGSHWLQVKKKPYNNEPIDEELIFHLGESILPKKIGTEWIKERVKEREDILKWLQKGVFNSEYERLDPKL